MWAFDWYQNWWHDLEWCIGYYFAFLWNSVAFQANYIKMVEDTPIQSVTERL